GRPSRKLLAILAIVFNDGAIVGGQQFPLIADAFDQLGSSVSLFDYHGHFPTDGVPRSLNSEKARRRALYLFFAQFARQGVVEEALNFLQINIEICHVSIPASPFFRAADRMRMNVGPSSGS